MFKLAALLFVMISFQSALDHLVFRLAAFHGASPGFIFTVRGMLKPIEIKKGKMLLEIGKWQDFVWLILSGSVNEISPSIESTRGQVNWFWFVDDFVFSCPGFFQGSQRLL